MIHSFASCFRCSNVSAPPQTALQSIKSCHKQHEGPYQQVKECHVRWIGLVFWRSQFATNWLDRAYCLRVSCLSPLKLQIRRGPVENTGRSWFLFIKWISQCSYSTGEEANTAVSGQCLGNFPRVQKLTIQRCKHRESRV